MKIIELTLTIAEILDLAKAANLIPHATTLADALLSDEDGETEYTIQEQEGGVVIHDDDNTPRKYAHGAYLTEYWEEGIYPLGPELTPPTP